jgi:flavodoxin
MTMNDGAALYENLYPFAIKLPAATYGVFGEGESAWEADPVGIGLSDI